LPNILPAFNNKQKVTQLHHNSKVSECIDLQVGLLQWVETAPSVNDIQMKDWHTNLRKL